MEAREIEIDLDRDQADRRTPGSVSPGRWQAVSDEACAASAVSPRPTMTPIASRQSSPTTRSSVERWFGLLTDKLIRRGVDTSVQALENDIRDWMATWNDNPLPFTWTKTADEILNSLADYLAKLGTGRETGTQD